MIRFPEGFIYFCTLLGSSCSVHWCQTAEKVGPVPLHSIPDGTQLLTARWVFIMNSTAKPRSSSYASPNLVLIQSSHFLTLLLHNTRYHHIVSVWITNTVLLVSVNNYNFFSNAGRDFICSNHERAERNNIVSLKASIVAAILTCWFSFASTSCFSMSNPSSCLSYKARLSITHLHCSL